jgi:hypothetical protein
VRKRNNGLLFFLAIDVGEDACRRYCGVVEYQYAASGIGTSN